MTTILEKGNWRLSAGKVTRMETLKREDGSPYVKEFDDGWVLNAVRRQTIEDSIVVPQRSTQGHGESPTAALEDMGQVEGFPFTAAEIERECRLLTEPKQ